MSWKAGVDVLTLGLTKTGAIGCEIIVLFGEARSKFSELKARAKRSGHMPPKMRYLAAQAIAMLEKDLWLTLAGQANQRARDVSDLLCRDGATELVHPVDGNEIFVRLSEANLAALTNAEATFYPWIGGSHRLVTSWCTPQATVDELSECLGS
jgi:threonine aldolase